MNTMTIAGNIGSVERIVFKSGDSKLKIRLADTKRWVDSGTGEAHENTIWYTVEAWNGRADALERYFQTGQKHVVITGTLKQVDTYISKKTGEAGVELVVALDKILSWGVKPNEDSE